MRRATVERGKHFNGPISHITLRTLNSLIHVPDSPKSYVYSRYRAPEYNDDPERTFDQILVWFDLAIVKVRARIKLIEQYKKEHEDDR